MISVLQVLGVAEHALRAILDMLVSSDNHVFGVETIHDDQLGKNFGFSVCNKISKSNLKEDSLV